MGVSDLTLISKISNEAINENLKKRFENAEIYVREAVTIESKGDADFHKLRHISAMSWSLSTLSEIVGLGLLLSRSFCG